MVACYSPQLINEPSTLRPLTESEAFLKANCGSQRGRIHAMNFLKIIMSIFLLTGLVMFYVSIEEHKKINHLLKSGVEVDAVVAELVPIKGGEHGTSYKPKFEYKDKKTGSTHFALGAVASNRPNFSVGEKVKLLY